MVLLRMVVQYLPSSLIPAALGLLSAALLTRLLDSQQYGRYSLILSGTGLLAALVSQWLQQGMNRYLPGETDPEAAADLKSAVGTALSLITLGVGLTACATVPFVWFLTPPEWRRLLWPAVALVITTALFTPLVVALQAELKARRFSLYQVSNATVRFALSLLVALPNFRDPSTLIAGTAATQALLIPFLWRETGMPRLKTVAGLFTKAAPLIRRMAAYGFPMIGWYLAATLLDAGDRFVIQFFRGSAEVGIYSANYTLVLGSVGLVSIPVLHAAHPFLMRAWGSDDQEGAARWLGIIVESLLVVGAFMVGAVSVLSADIARWLIGPGFREGHVVMPVVLAGTLAWQVGMYAHKPLEFSGQTKRMLWYCLLAVAANLALNVAFVPAFGYPAAAWATLAAYALYVLLAARAGREVLSWQIDWTRLGAALAVCLISVVAARAARQYTEAQFGYVAGLATVAVLLGGAAAGLFWRLLRRYSA